MGLVASSDQVEASSLPDEEEAPERVVAHIDLDAFYVSVELQRNPDLKGLAVVVAGEGPRAVVTTASYEARKHGVGSAMPAAKARRLCPDAIFIKPDHAHYKEASAAVMSVLDSHLDVVEQVGLDEAYADLTGLTAPAAAMRRVMKEIEDRTGLHSSVGIGPNRLVAKVASDADKPRGFVVLTRAQAIHRFSDDPCSLLPGIGPRTVERLRALGITTIRQLAHADRDMLIGRFGPKHGPHLIELGSFIDETPVRTDREAVSESREVTFDEDVKSREELEHRLDILTGELCSALTRHGHAGRTISIKVRYDDFETHTRSKTIHAATRDPVVVAGMARQLLADFSPSKPVRLLGVRVSGFESSAQASGQLALPIA